MYFFQLNTKSDPRKPWQPNNNNNRTTKGGSMELRCPNELLNPLSSQSLKKPKGNLEESISRTLADGALLGEAKNQIVCFY